MEKYKIEEVVHKVKENFIQKLSMNPPVKEVRNYIENEVKKSLENLGLNNIDERDLKYIYKPFFWSFISPNYVPKIGFNGNNGKECIEFNREITEKEFEKYRTEMIKRISYVISEPLPSQYKNQ